MMDTIAQCRAQQTDVVFNINKSMRATPNGCVGLQRVLLLVRHDSTHGDTRARARLLLRLYSAFECGWAMASLSRIVVDVIAGRMQCSCTDSRLRI